jgi:hypothetical protein
VKPLTVNRIFTRPHLPERSRLKKLLRPIALGLAAALLIWLVVLGALGIHLALTARALMNELQAPKIDFSKIQGHTITLTGDLQALQSAASPLFPLLRATQGIPGVGLYLGQVEPLLNFASGLAQAGKPLLTAFQPLLAEQNPGGGLTAVEKLLQAIQANPAALDEAHRIIAQAARAREQINPLVFPEPYRTYYTRLNAYFPLLQYGMPALKQLPSLMGATGRQNILVVAENRDELRATGGFITGLGLAALENGKIVSFNLGDSYAIEDYSKDHPPAPTPLKQFMLADYWVTRDANWSPDFPTAAAEVQKLYTLSTGFQTSGVVAFNQLALKGILEVLGPVPVEGYPDLVSAASVENFMRQSWAPDPKEGVTDTWWANRKKFMGDLGRTILSRMLSSSDPKRLIALGRVVLEQLSAGQLLIYVDQPEIRTLLGQAGLDGALNPAAGDYLSLVDSNIGFNKVDTVIKRAIIYQVDLSQPRSPTAEFQATYQHNITTSVDCKHEASYGKGTYADMQTRCYWDYWRVYLAAGSRLSGSTVPPVAGQMLLNKTDWNGPAHSENAEKGLTVVSGLMVLPTNSRQEFKLALQLAPNSLKSLPQGTWTYALRIQKQPGLELLPVTVTVKLPEGSLPVIVPSGWVKQPGQNWVWQGNLSGTQDLSLTFCCTP